VKQEIGKNELSICYVGFEFELNDVVFNYITTIRLWLCHSLARSVILIVIWEVAFCSCKFSNLVRLSLFYPVSKLMYGQGGYFLCISSVMRVKIQKCIVYTLHSDIRLPKLCGKQKVVALP
jgi:hypothetical protein